jgi:hypothetical protein
MQNFKNQSQLISQKNQVLICQMIKKKLNKISSLEENLKDLHSHKDLGFQRNNERLLH